MKYERYNIFDQSFYKDVRLGAQLCPNCGFEFDEYYESGRFGCVQCYTSFRDKIRHIVREIHGGTRHAK